MYRRSKKIDYVIKTIKINTKNVKLVWSKSIVKKLHLDNKTSIHHYKIIILLSHLSTNQTQ